MAHWSVDDPLKEIKDLESLHALRPQSMVVSNLLKGLETKVQAMDCLTPSMLVKLTEALDASSLTDEMKQSLHDLVEARAMEANSGALRLQNQPQVLLSLYKLHERSRMGTAPASSFHTSSPNLCEQDESLWVEVNEGVNKKACVGYVDPPHAAEGRTPTTWH